MPIWLLVCCALGRKEALRRENLEEGRPLGLLPLKEWRAHPVFSLSPSLCFSASRKWVVFFPITFSFSQNQRHLGQELRPEKSLNFNQNKCFLLLDERSQLCVTMIEGWTNMLYQSSVFIWSLLSFSCTRLPTHQCSSSLLLWVFDNAFKLHCGGRRIKLNRHFSNTDGSPSYRKSTMLCVLILSSRLYSLQHPGFP